VRSVRQADSKLIVETGRAQEALIGLLEIANRLDAQVTALEVFEPNLETVFLHLTGKRLRD
jgi:ABC-2 type transport system ATP-binding protein